jgi:hypothetical protein
MQKKNSNRSVVVLTTKTDTIPCPAFPYRVKIPQTYLKSFERLPKTPLLYNIHSPSPMTTHQPTNLVLPHLIQSRILTPNNSSTNNKYPTTPYSISWNRITCKRILYQKMKNSHTFHEPLSEPKTSSSSIQESSDYSISIPNAPILPAIRSKFSKPSTFQKKDQQNILEIWPQKPHDRAR